MSKNVLSLSLAVILSLSLLSACTKDSDSPKAPNMVRGEVREERREENREEDEESETRGTQSGKTENQATPQPVAPVQNTTPAPTPTQTQAPTPAPVAPAAPVTPAAPASQAKTVTKTVSYEVPEGGATSSTFTVSVGADGMIASVSSAMASGEKDSVVFNRIFAVSISAQAVGKKPSELASLSAVGGASLTTTAFKSFVASM